MNTTSRSGGSDEARDIQVITDIHVQVENDTDTVSDWKPTGSPKNWSETTSDKGLERANSTEQLVEFAEPPRKSS